ncbi:hypothetical protein [Caudoviricetes sp.]|nr:hypothetical protein [Caudoviricetes sp.]
MSAKQARAAKRRKATDWGAHYLAVIAQLKREHKRAYWGHVWPVRVLRWAEA